MASKRQPSRINLNAAVEWVPPDSLKPNPKNARTHSKKQILRIAASIRQFRFLNPVIVDDKNVVLAGHGRLEAARLEGWPEVPILRFDHLTEAQKRAYAIADNKIAEQAGWDREILPQRSRCFPRSHRSPGTVTGSEGGDTTASSGAGREPERHSFKSCGQKYRALYTDALPLSGGLDAAISSKVRPSALQRYSEARRLGRRCADRLLGPRRHRAGSIRGLGNNHSTSSDKR